MYINLAVQFMNKIVINVFMFYYMGRQITTKLSHYKYYILRVKKDKKLSIYNSKRLKKEKRKVLRGKINSDNIEN